MARPRSEFLSSLGKLFSIFKKVVDLVLEFGGSDEVIAKIDTDDALAKDIAAVITSKAKVVYQSNQEEISKGEKLLAYLLKVEPHVIVELRGDSRDIMTGELWKALRKLSYREREIIKLRYGIGDGYAYTLEETGNIFKVTRERVRQVEAKAVRKLEHSDCSGPILEEFKRATSRFGANAQYQEEVSEVVTESPEDILEKPVTALAGLSLRARKVMLRLKVQTIRGLTILSEKDLLSDTHCGPLTVSEIRDKLHAYNLKLREDA